MPYQELHGSACDEDRCCPRPTLPRMPHRRTAQASRRQGLGWVLHSQQQSAQPPTSAAKNAPGDVHARPATQRKSRVNVLQGGRAAELQGVPPVEHPKPHALHWNDGM